jgi:hypothetical protein
MVPFLAGLHPTLAPFKKPIRIVEVFNCHDGIRDACRDMQVTSF